VFDYYFDDIFKSVSEIQIYDMELITMIFLLATAAMLAMFATTAMLMTSSAFSTILHGEQTI
jgi:hypothetical protein